MARERRVPAYKRDHNMQRPGDRLKHFREKLGMTYRDVAAASRQIARRHDNDDFAIALSRLADIENKGTVPTIFRLYSLCAIYGLDLVEVQAWYGVPAEAVAAESLLVPRDATHLLQNTPRDPLPFPHPPNLEIDLNRTTFLSHLIKRWGSGGLTFLNGVDLRHHRYGLIGLEDWSMYPILHPGAVVLIDQGRRRIATSGWTSEIDRPIYFLEHREGFRCSWCALEGTRIILLPHPGSQSAPEFFEADGIDVVGQVTGVAMLLETKARRHARSGATAAKSLDP
jgi:transcriptional regulator with XRE-family HTH domain